MRYIYILDENNNISSMELQYNRNFQHDIFPFTDQLWIPETQQSIETRKGFFGNSFYDTPRKFDILKQLKLIVIRKKDGWEAYQIKGLAREFIQYLIDNYDITIEDLKSIM